MKKKIICLITCFMLVIGSFFALIPIGTAKADTIMYEGFVSSDSSVIPDYAVTSIEELNYNVRVEYTFTYDSNEHGRLEVGWWNSSSSRLTSFHRLTLSNSFNPGDIFPNSYDEGFCFFELETNDYNNSVQCWVNNDTSGTFYIAENSGSFDFTFIFLFNYKYYDNLDVFVDMQANNDLFSLFRSSDTFCSDLYFKNNISGEKQFNRTLFSDVSCDTFSGSNFVSLNTWFYNSLFELSNISFTCIPYEVNFSIYRPTERVNNTLVFYNYNYTFLNSVHNIEYTLRKNNTYYTIQCMQDIPNAYYIFISSVETQNKIFDEYITLNLSGTVSSTSTSYVLNSFVNDTGYIKMPFGFDFNFTYYNEPLVASNGSYNFDFEKPGYVDMPFSLSPFYIPVLEAVENVFIFLIFYCPIISDILGLIELDLFIGGLLSIVNYLLGLNVGQFVIGCIAFIIFFSILKTFMPVIYSSNSEINMTTKTYIHVKNNKQKFTSSQQKDLNSNKWESPYKDKK